MKIHLYSPPFAHGDAYVVADSEGLKALRDAIDAALRKGSTAIETEAGDGEGYVLFVMGMETRDPKWSDLHLPLPYPVGGDYSTPRSQGIHPFDVLGRPRYQELQLHARSLSTPPQSGDGST